MDCGSGPPASDIHMPLNFMVKGLAFMLCIQDVPHSYVALEAAYPD